MCLELALVVSKTHQEATIFILVENTFFANEGFEQALERAERARAVAESAGDLRLTAAAFDLLGSGSYNRVLHGGEGGYEQAVSCFQRALATWEELQDSRGIAAAQFGLGLIAERLEDSEQAGGRYETALEQAKSHGHKLEESYAERHLAGLAEDAGDLDAALAGFQRSLALREELGYHVLLPLSLLAVGDVLREQGHKADAEEHYLRALTLSETMEVPLALLESPLAVASTKQRSGDMVKAHDLYRRALTVAEAGHFSRETAAASQGLAETVAG